jgi:hypothetical protein
VPGWRVLRALDDGEIAMSEVRPKPCPQCPYRKDVPSGVWAETEYAKLPPYDEPTFAQPMEGFACHSSPAQFCNGWAICHTSRGNEFDLLALRLRPAAIPEPSVEMFGSGAEAAEHGMRDVASPSPEAKAAVADLQRKHARLR